MHDCQSTSMTHKETLFLLPFHKAYHQYPGREIPLWLVPSSFGCIGCVAPTHLPNWGKVDPLTPETWNYFRSAVGKTSGPGLSRCEHGSFPYGKTLQNEKKVYAWKNSRYKKEMKVEMDEKMCTWEKVLNAQKIIKWDLKKKTKNWKQSPNLFLSRNSGRWYLNLDQILDLLFWDKETFSYSLRHVKALCKNQSDKVICLKPPKKVLF